MAKERHNWLDPQRQIIPPDQIPDEFKKVVQLPNDSTQIIDTRYPYRYWPDLGTDGAYSPCLNCAVEDFDVDPSLIPLVRQSLDLTKK